jgi:acetyl-CoA carboxylase carboxyl transferase subunit beta
MANNEESRGLKSLFDWFANRRKSGSTSLERQEREIADGLWHKCPKCGVLSYAKDLRANQMVCVECDHHNRVDSDERIRQLIDQNTWKPMDEHLRPSDPLQFRDRKPYSDRLREMQEKIGLIDAVKTGLGQINGGKTHPDDRASNSKTLSSRNNLYIWWGENAGRNAVFDADG